MMVSTSIVRQSGGITNHWTRWYVDNGDILEEPVFTMLVNSYDTRAVTPLRKVLYRVVHIPFTLYNMRLIIKDE